MSDSNRTTRDREGTKQKFIEAAIAIIRENGFEELGVNAVAERAGVSKVLLYRYFGNMTGLYSAIAEAIDPLQSRRAEKLFREFDVQKGGSKDSVGHDETAQEFIREVVLSLHTALKDDELTKNLLIWELSHTNSITELFSSMREKTGLQMSERFREQFRSENGSVRGIPDDLDVNAVLAVMTASVFYLTLRGDSVAAFNGIDLQSEDGWDRIADVFSRMLRG